MIIKTNAKDEVIEFTAENKVDAYCLGSVFDNKNHEMKIIRDGDHKEELKVTVGVWEIWRILNNGQKINKEAAQKPA